VECEPASPSEREEGCALILALGWNINRIQLGDPFVAKDGDEVVGFLRLEDGEPDGTYVADVVVREDVRGRGIGSELMRVAMAACSGPFFLSCHSERMAFYERLGFAETAKGGIPPAVAAVAAIAGEAAGELETAEDHIHHFMRAG